MEEDAFWARHFPGLRALAQREQEALKVSLRKTRTDLYERYQMELAEAESTRHALVQGPFPGMGTGDPDLYKAFCWRFWFLVAEQRGRIGVVLPRAVLAAKGSEEFRWVLFREAKLSDMATLANTARWAFDMEARYTIALAAIHKGTDSESKLQISGPFSSLTDFHARSKEGTLITAEQALSSNDSASMPLLFDKSVDVFAQLRKAPRRTLTRLTSGEQGP